MSKLGSVELGEKFFKLRDYTPAPLLVLMVFINQPTVLTATVGTLLVLLGQLLRIYSVAFIGSISRTRKESLGARLVTTGPFGVVRNPLYVANACMVVGISVYTSQFWFVIVSLLGFAFQYYHIVLFEEGLLLREFGEEFEDYRSRVPRWIPNQVPNLEDLELPSSILPAVMSERRTMTALLVVLVLLIATS